MAAAAGGADPVDVPGVFLLLVLDPLVRSLRRLAEGFVMHPANAVKLIIRVGLSQMSYTFESRHLLIIVVAHQSKTDYPIHFNRFEVIRILEFGIFQLRGWGGALQSRLASCNQIDFRESLCLCTTAFVVHHARSNASRLQSDSVIVYVFADFLRSPRLPNNHNGRRSLSVFAEEQLGAGHVFLRRYVNLEIFAATNAKLDTFIDNLRLLSLLGTLAFQLLLLGEIAHNLEVGDELLSAMTSGEMTAYWTTDRGTPLKRN